MNREGRSESAFLYVSDLSPGAGRSAIADIAEGSRRYNAAENITGLLMFDGSSFAQWLEGPVRPMDALLGRLRADPRHHRMDVLWFESPCLGRRFPRWHFGYLDARGTSPGLSALRGAHGVDAMLLFGKMSRGVATERQFARVERRSWGSASRVEDAARLALDAVKP